jgi:ubiquinone/menaquinone biosynthesis C-methylase UbiE
MHDDAPEANNYLDAWHERHAGATSAVLGTMIDHEARNSYRVLADAMLDSGEPVLDLACGDGYLLGLPGWGSRCLGADRSLAELRAARRRLRPVFPLVQGDAAQLPFAAASLSAVSCHYALMLLQPLEEVLAELSRVLQSGGLFVAVIPTAPPEDGPTPWSAFRDAWREVTTFHPVVIPPLADSRALQHDQLSALLADAGFTSSVTRSFSVSKRMTVDEAVQTFLLTYLPDLLPSTGFTELANTLGAALTELAADDGSVLFSEHANLVAARRP